MSDSLPVPAASNTFELGIMDHGYRGLYGGLGRRDIHARRRLNAGQKKLAENAPDVET
jgi:hypothetical protein